MTKEQLRRLDMYRATLLYLTNNATIWNQVPAILTTIENLEDNLKKMEKSRQTQKTSLKGVTEHVQDKRQQLITLTAQFVAALRAYAVSINDKILLAKVDFTLSELQRLPAEELFDTAQLVFDLSQGIEKKLEAFCLKETKITQMKTLLADYNSQSPDKRLLQIESKTATQNLATLFAQTDALLRDSLDLMLKPFAIEYDPFYQQYLQARKMQAKNKKDKPTPKTDSLKTV